MLGGSMEGFPVMIAVIIMVTLITTFAFFLSAELVNVKAFSKESRESIDEVDIAHLIASCLESNGMINEAFLDENNGKSIDELGCEMSAPGANIKIKDLQSGKAWNFGSSGLEGLGNSAFTIISAADGLHMGEINADI